MGKRRDAATLSSEDRPRFDSPFAGLQGLRDALPEGTPPAPGEGGAREKAPAALPAEGPPKAPPRATVRYQRKGRGGKEVTLVEGLALPQAALADWLKDLKRRLGCGGVVEGDVLVLQGDQRERLPSVLQERGVKRVVVSG